MVKVASVRLTTTCPIFWHRLLNGRLLMPTPPWLFESYLLFISLMLERLRRHDVRGVLYDTDQHSLNLHVSQFILSRVERMVFQSSFMITTVQPLACASSSALSRRPMDDVRS